MKNLLALCTTVKWKEVLYDGYRLTGLSYCDNLNPTTMNYWTRMLREHSICVVKYSLKKPLHSRFLYSTSP